MSEHFSTIEWTVTLYSKVQPYLIVRLIALEIVLLLDLVLINYGLLVSLFIIFFILLFYCA